MQLLEADTLGKRIRFYRQQAHLSTYRLGSLVGVVHHTITQIEKGTHSPNVARVQAIAKALGTDAEHLFPEPLRVCTILRTQRRTWDKARTFGKRLRWFRLLRHMTLVVFAAAAGVQRDNIIQVELHDAMPSAKRAQNYARILDIHPGWLFPDTWEPKQRKTPVYTHKKPMLG